MINYSAKCAGLCLLIVLAVQPLLAQAPSANALADEAEKFFQAKDWVNAARAYEAITKIILLIFKRGTD